MKTTIPFFLLFIASWLLLTSCNQKSTVYENAISIDREDFRTYQSLTGSVITFDTTGLLPVKLKVYDSLLITINRKENKLFHAYNMKTKKKIGEYITTGQGPNEMIQPHFAGNKEDAIQIFDLPTRTLYEYPLISFIQNNLNGSSLKLKEPFWGEIALLNQSIITATFKAESLFYIFNKEGNKIGLLGDYPISTELTYTDTEKVEAFRFTFTTNSDGRVAVCYSWTDLVEIYDKNGKLLSRTHGPEHFLAYFKEFNEGKIVSARPVKGKCRDAFFNPVSVGDEFFVLFNGKNTDEEGYSILADHILVFDWDGNPKRIFKLNHGIFTFTVDMKQKKIYGISDTPEYHILEFSYE